MDVNKKIPKLDYKNMTPKIIVYFSKDSEACYKVLHSLDGVYGLLSDRTLWPIFIDLSFKFMDVKKVCEILSHSPHFSYLSQSLTCAMLPGETKFLTDWFVEIETRKAYPISIFMGKFLATEQEIVQRYLSIQKMKPRGPIVDPVDTVLDSDLSDYEFSVRTTNILKQLELLTFRDLTELSDRHFLKQPNCGQKSLNELKIFLLERGFEKFGKEGKTDKPKFDAFIQKSHKKLFLGAFGVTSAHCDDTGPTNIFENLFSALGQLHERQNVILRKRIGLGEKRKTLGELGEFFGVTKERIRQIELKAWTALKHPSRGWNPENIWGTAVEKAFTLSLVPLSAYQLVDLDSRFEFQGFGEKALSYLLTNALIGSAICFEVEVANQTFFAKMDQTAVDLAQQGISSLLPVLEGRPVAEIEPAVMALVPAGLSEFSSLFITNALKHSVIEEIKGQFYLQVYSPRRSAMTIARKIFEDLEYQITNQQFSELLGRDYPDANVHTVMNCARSLPNVFPFARGVWGTVDLLRLTTSEMLEIKTLILNFVGQINKDQFHSNEICDYLMIHNADFYNRLDIFQISGLVRYFEIANYLEHQMFSQNSNDVRPLR